VSGSEPGRNPWGYTKSENVPGEDGKPVSSEFAQCWPPGTPGIGAAAKRAPGGGVVQPKRSLIHDPAPRGKKKRPKPRKAK
jgi:hypothetical protein